MSARRRGRLPIRRIPDDGSGFAYRDGTRRIRSKREIARIEALAIPPAWGDVEIARSPRAKVLARGVDAAGRTQAIYHPAFRRRQERRKFDRVRRFGRALPRLRARVDQDLRRRRLSEDRIAACVIRLIDLQLFRVGNAEYAARHRSYGVTTLTEQHLRATGSAVEFDFVGKSGQRQRRRVRDPRIARIVSQLLQLPGPEVFRFFDEDGIVHELQSRHVNAYVKRHMGAEYTAKDFRTWGGTVTVAAALLDADPADLASARGREAVVRSALSSAAERLGNTRAVARSSYVDPRVLSAVEHPEVLDRVRGLRTRPRRYLERSEQRTLRLLHELERAGVSG